MPRLSPDHRALRVFSMVYGKQPFVGSHADEHALYEYLQHGRSPTPQVDEAYGIYEEPQFRHVVDAALLAHATDAFVCDALEMPLTVMSVYRHLFFDRSVFRHVLDVSKYVKELPVTPEERTYYTTAYEKGPETLLNRFRIGKRPDLEPRAVLKELLADQIERARGHRGQPLNSELAREALRWAQATANTANILLREDTQAEHALSELKLTLAVEDRTVSVNDLVIKPGDLVH